MNYNVTVNGKVYNVTVEKTGAAAPVVAAPVAEAGDAPEVEWNEGTIRIAVSRL